MRTKIKCFVHDEEGASMIEYGLLVGLIALVAIAAVTTLGTSLNSKIDDAASSLNS